VDLRGHCYPIAYAKLEQLPYEAQTRVPGFDPRRPLDPLAVARFKAPSSATSARQLGNGTAQLRHFFNLRRAPRGDQA